MTKPDDGCKVCRFYKPYMKDRNDGLCRRHPPAPPAPKSLLWALSEINWFIAKGEETANSVEFDPEGQRSDDHDRSLWPLVYDDDWCGEFQNAKA